MNQPDNKKPTNIEQSTKVGAASTSISDNHVVIGVEEILRTIVAPEHPWFNPDKAVKIAKRQLDQYYADFYRNKILEELKKELREHHDKYPDMDFGETMGYIVGFQNRTNPITAQFNSKGDSDE